MQDDSHGWEKIWYAHLNFCVERWKQVEMEFGKLNKQEPEVGNKV